ncbi:MAG: hypothetical protein JJ913_13065 [Rhizobiaceae bacterium]|nr:hypothetical protein [Rhizobiaceae bacterium]
MTSQDKKEPVKRPRGRPKGNGPYAERDLEVLAQYADVLIDAKDAKLARVLKAVGYDNEKDIRRARIRWDREKGRLLEEARKRRDGNLGATLLELIARFIAVSSAISNAIAPALVAVNQSLERARARQSIMMELGLNPELPLDLRDQEAVAEALSRYEARMFRSIGEKGAKLPPVPPDQLPAHLKVYVAAVQLHELSLQMAGRAAEEVPEHGDDQNFSEGDVS